MGISGSGLFKICNQISGPVGEKKVDPAWITPYMFFKCQGILPSDA